MSKLTKRELRRIIKEETLKVLEEAYRPGDPEGATHQRSCKPNSFGCFAKNFEWLYDDLNKVLSASGRYMGDPHAVAKAIFAASTVMGTAADRERGAPSPYEG